MKGLFSLSVFYSLHLERMDLQGGAIIGEGSYGCVFDKPLKCAGKKKLQIKKDRLGKITLAYDAAQEVHISNTLRKAPLWQNFFILTDPESCKLAPIKEQTEKQLNECGPLVREVQRIQYSDMKQIFLPWGGRQFGSILHSNDIRPEKFDFYNFMIHILKGVGTMTLAGVCHFDIHPGNILVDQNKVARIIDFAMSFRGSTIKEEEINDHWKQLAFGNSKKTSHWISNQEPPEVTIMNAINHNYGVEDAIEEVVYGKDIFKQMSKPLIGTSRAVSIKKLEDFWKTSKCASSMDWTTFWRSYWTGYDSWALGTMLYTLLMMQLSFRSFADSSTWKEKRVPILTALRGMLEPSPRYRIDVIEALALIDPGNPWLTRFGGAAWLDAKVKQRADLPS